MRPIRITLLGDADSIMADEPAVSLRKDEVSAGARTEPYPEPDARPRGAGPPGIRPLPTSGGERTDGHRLYEVTVGGWVLRYRVEDEGRAELLERGRRSGASAKAHVREKVRARIPGRVTRIWVEQGQEVAAGERLLALEAMKMENEVRAPHGGTVVAIHVRPGQPVELNTELVTLD